MVACSHKRIGFSLIELLVAISIILILAALLFRMMGDLQERGRAIDCQSNLRSIHGGIFSFLGDNDGYWPPGRENMPVSSWNPWAPHIVPAYLQELPRCTELSESGYGSGGSGYGTNLYLIQDWPNINMLEGSRFRNGRNVPGHPFIVLAGCENNSRNFYANTHHDRTAYASEMFGSPYGDPQFHGYGGLYNQRQLNFVFLDGRVELIARGPTAWTSSSPTVYAPFDQSGITQRPVSLRMRRDSAEFPDWMLGNPVN